MKEHKKYNYVVCSASNSRRTAGSYWGVGCRDNAKRWHLIGERGNSVIRQPVWSLPRIVLSSCPSFWPSCTKGPPPSFLPPLILYPPYAFRINPGLLAFPSKWFVPFIHFPVGQLYHGTIELFRRVHWHIPGSYNYKILISYFLIVKNAVLL